MGPHNALAAHIPEELDRLLLIQHPFL